MWTWNNVDRDTMNRIANDAKWAHEHETEILDARIQFDAVVTGLKARLQAEPDGGLEALQQLYPTLTDVEEFFAAAYIVTALFGDAIANGRTALAATLKF